MSNEISKLEDLFHFEDCKPNFDSLAKQNGFTYWYASDLMKCLGYSTLESFNKAILKAMSTCASLNIDISDNFVQEYKELTGKKVKDYRLSRFACYLVAMNADSKKPEVAKAQAFFAVIAEAFRKYVQDSEDVERVLVRDEITTQEKLTDSAAKQAGVTEFGLFKDHGYRGLYNKTLAQLKNYKGIDPKRTPLDFMGREELAANLFRLTQTEAKLEKDGYIGQKRAENTAYQVGKTVRETMISISGNKPEDLGIRKDIKKVKSKLRSSQKDFAKIDGNSTKSKKLSDLASDKIIDISIDKDI